MVKTKFILCRYDIIEFSMRPTFPPKKSGNLACMTLWDDELVDSHSWLSLTYDRCKFVVIFYIDGCRLFGDCHFVSQKSDHLWEFASFLIFQYGLLFNIDFVFILKGNP